MVSARAELYKAIIERFRASKIDIPFPLGNSHDRGFIEQSGILNQGIKILGCRSVAIAAIVWHKY